MVDIHSFCVAFSSALFCGYYFVNSNAIPQSKEFVIPTYSGTEVVQIDDNFPDFRTADISTDDYVQFSELDILGRCGVVIDYLSGESYAETPSDSQSDREITRNVVEPEAVIFTPSD